MSLTHYTTIATCFKIKVSIGVGGILREEHRRWRYYSNTQNHVFDGQALAGCSDFRLVTLNAKDSEIEP